MTPKTEKDNLWKELKLQWSHLKRDSGADEVKKGEAKKRINEIQDALKLDKTDWNTPRTGPPGSHLTNAGASTNPSDKLLIEKVLGTVLDAKRIQAEEFIALSQRLNTLEQMVERSACNCSEKHACDGTSEGPPND
jgi:hypothetical protein